jgi:hypothetical protein
VLVNECLKEFLDTVAEQAVRQLGWRDSEGRGDSASNAREVARLLVEDAVGASEERHDVRLDRAARELAHAPPLLAAFYQNIDLLYGCGYESADAVSALVMRALERSAELPRS